jgi:hypothetical protein
MTGCLYCDVVTCRYLSLFVTLYPSLSPLKHYQSHNLIHLSSYLLIFLSSYLLIFLSSYLLIFLSSYLLIFLSSYLLIFLSFSILLFKVYIDAHPCSVTKVSVENLQFAPLYGRLGPNPLGKASVCVRGKDDFKGNLLYSTPFRMQCFGSCAVWITACNMIGMFLEEREREGEERRRRGREKERGRALRGRHPTTWNKPSLLPRDWSWCGSILNI